MKAARLAILISVSLAAVAFGQTQSVPALHVFDVKSFGAVGDGKALDTEAISDAVDAAAASGGGRVVFTPGTYLTGTFQLRSDVTLELQAGAVIQGSPRLSDYVLGATLGFGKQYAVNSSGEGDYVGIIVARDVENVAIVGQGRIDGNGDAFFDLDKPHIGKDFDARYTRNPEGFTRAVNSTGDGPVEFKSEGRPGTMIVFSHARNVVVRDVTFSNAPNWTFHLQHARQAVIHGLHIENNLALPNNDGFDCMDCHDIHVSDCDFSAGDDDFAIVGSEDVHVTNCTLVSRSSGIRLEDTRRSTFTGLSIQANRGIGVYERGGGNTGDILFSDIVIRTRLLTGHWWGKAEPIYIATAGKSSGGVHDVTFSNIVAQGESGMVIYGAPENPIRNIDFDRVRLIVVPPRKEVADEVGGNFDLRWTSPKIETAVFKHDIPALYCRWVDGIELRGLKVKWDDGVPAYFSDAIACEDFKNLKIWDFEGREAPGPAGRAAINLRRGDGFSIGSSTAAPGTRVFLAADQLEHPGLFVDNDLSAAKKAFSPVRPRFIRSDDSRQPSPRAKR